MFEWLRPEPERPVLDTAYLARLSGLLGQTALDELLADGLIEISDRAARVAEFAGTGDVDNLRRLGHDLVGMAGHLGLTRLSAAAAELGRRLRETGDGAADAAAEVCREAAAAAQALCDYLGQ